MESERWFRVSKVKEIEKMEGGSNCNSNYYNHDVMRSGPSLMPPPLMNSLTAAADQTSSSSNQQHYFVSLPFTNISPNQNDGQGYEMMSMKAKVMGHPLFPRLLASYVNCQKVYIAFSFSDLVAFPCYGSEISYRSIKIIMIILILRLGHLLKWWLG